MSVSSGFYRVSIVLNTMQLLFIDKVAGICYLAHAGSAPAGLCIMAHHMCCHQKVVVVVFRGEILLKQSAERALLNLKGTFFFTWVNLKRRSAKFSPKCFLLLILL